MALPYTEEILPKLALLSLQVDFYGYFYCVDVLTV